MPDVAELRSSLLSLADPTYKTFNAKLIPTVDTDTMIGIRTPVLRTLARQLAREQPATVEQFLADLPHAYFEENMLHAILLGTLPLDCEEVCARLASFLPYVDNWSVCDTIRPRAFARAPAGQLLEQLEAWLADSHEYTVRFAVICMMIYCLDDARFDTAHLATIARISRKEYYINMARAWYFATALARQWAVTIPLIESQCLDSWTHNKTIQKARESHRVPREHKEYLKSLKI